VQISAVRVFGDSLADAGTFGAKYTVQASDSRIYPELVAQAYGISALCNFYAYNGTTLVANPTAGCTDYAVAGGKINYTTAPTAPFSVIQQLATAGASVSYTATDLLLVDGGGNDAADLVGAYLQAATDGGVAYSGLLKTLLPSATVDTTLATGASGFVTAGGLYMVALADSLANAIETHAINKGASRVALLNMPAVDKTPRFQGVLDSIAAAHGGGTAGATARAQADALVTGWIQAYNTELAAQFSGNTKVVIVDFYTGFEQQFETPAQFGLTNVTTPACGSTVVTSCSGAALSAQAPPAGGTGSDWWKRYGFADNFHPTPYGHQLIYQLVSKSLAQAGWL
jgi:phospholipase/lecithinase/hemolysin